MLVGYLFVVDFYTHTHIYIYMLVDYLFIFIVAPNSLI
jgi:hypothetical protein